MRKRLFAMGLVVLLTPAAAHAHGLFWQATPAGFVLMEGHLPGQEHDGEAAAPLARGRVSALLVDACAKGFGSGAEIWEEVPLPADGPVLAPADAPAVMAVVDWGWWTKSADGTRNVHPDSVAGALQAWTSQETVKYLAEACWSAPSLAGRGLEVSPEDGAIPSLCAGDKINLVVTLDGAPVAAAVVTYDGKVRGVTGAGGDIRLKVRHGGLQIIRATLRRPAASPPWAEDVRTGTLIFELGDQ